MSGGRIIAEGRDKEILENPEVVEMYLGAES
jgi:ABC-type branched-subunit amino acid transport system ATPase component